MPAISPAVQNLIRDGKLAPSEIPALRSAVQSGQAKAADVELLASRFANAFDAGVGSEVQKLLRELGRAPNVDAPVANLGNAPGLLNGSVLLPRDKDSRQAELTLVQKGMMALSLRLGDPSLMLPKYGADGSWGAESELAVRAFQKKFGLAETGVVDMATAQRLDRELRNTRVPPIFAGGVDPNPVGLESMKNAASTLVAKRGASFGVDAAWINCDPRHALPANVSLGGLKGKWKCNLFACNTMAAAGFEPPFYGNRGRGEYPNANQLYKWSDRYASQNGNAGHVHFELRGELRVVDVADPAEKERRIKDLLARVEPGDMVIVDHLGNDVADGGHCRVAVAKNNDGTFGFAQAGFSAAEIRTENHNALMNEEHIWILRPNKRRPEGPAPV
jgi:peptidoglycan hydrolase-like protein with peptidoglycan-binding domain